MTPMSKLSKYGMAAIILAGVSQGSAWAAAPAQHPATVHDAAASNKSSVVKQVAAGEMLKRQHALTLEAMDAHQEMLQAIENLDKHDKDKAYKNLTDASGKLDIVMARDPNLKMALIGVQTYSRDLDAKNKDVKKVVEQAKVQLIEGHIQEARALLAPLSSELRITTEYLPMETYPAAIKTASKEIQDDKLQEAEQLLTDTLDSIVSKEEIVPLPPLRAEIDTLHAEQLITNDKIKNRDEALTLLTQAKQQLELGKLLGYSEYKDIKSEIASVSDKINAGQASTGLFARLKAMFHHSKT